MTALPNFVCIGAPKTGTTALHEDMAGHPDVFLPAVKETHFFRLAFGGLPWGGPGPRPPMEVDTREKYERLFGGATGYAAIGEICPSYFAEPAVAQDIRATLGPVRILIMLRDPVARAFSQFLHARLIGCEPEPSFLKAIALEEERAAAQWGEFWSYLGQSRYAEVVERYFNVFGRDNVMVIRHDRYVRERVDSLREIYAFVGVDPDFAEQQAAPERQVNVSGVPTNPLAAFAFRNIEVMARIARVAVPTGLRRSVRKLLDRSLTKAIVTEEERRTLLPLLVDDIQRLERLLEWDLAVWRQ